MSFEIDISCRPDSPWIDVKALRHAIEMTLEIEQVDSTVLSVSIVDNRSIHQINREHLQHDYPTDVISFQLDFALDDDAPDDANSELRAAGAITEGEIIASAEMAGEMAATGQWSPMDELTLYVVHGLLHICGYDDLTPEEKAIMRRRECVILTALNLHPVYPDDERQTV